jgi:hypothetical protein
MIRPGRDRKPDPGYLRAGSARTIDPTARRGWRQFSNTGKDWRQIRRSGRGI